MLIKTLVTRAIKQDRPANILCYYCDGFFERMLAETGHRFFGNNTNSVFRWGVTDPIPNTTEIPSKMDVNLTDATFDLIITNDRFKQVQHASGFASAIGVPIIQVDHSGKPTQVADELYNEVWSKTQNLPIDVVRTSKGGLDWSNTDTMIPYFWPDNTGGEKSLEVLISGRFNQSEYKLVEEILGNFDDAAVIGPNPGFSEPVSWEEYCQLFQSAKVYISLATDSNLPHGIGMAANSGCAIVSNRIPAVEEFNTNGGISIGKNVPEIVELAQNLLASEKFLEKRQQDAAGLNTGSRDEFVGAWNELIERVRYKTVVR